VVVGDPPNYRRGDPYRPPLTKRDLDIAATGVGWIPRLCLITAIKSVVLRQEMEFLGADRTEI
jgi:hypothetical protein